MAHDLPLLDETFPLPLDAPFTFRDATTAGITPNRLTTLTRLGLLRRPMRGVYVAAQVPDTLRMRAQVLALVVPAHAVVTDRTAGWLHVGPRVLAPNDHLVAPLPRVFDARAGHRMRNSLCESGERRMRLGDVEEIEGIRVTSPLRTCLDLGRLLHRDQAFAALDAMLSTVDHQLLLDSVERFRGYRGVRQLRALAPLADARSESQGESVLRLRWLDCPHLPAPDRPQIVVPAPGGRTYRIDLGIEALRLGVEYDGAAFHGPDRAERDAGRRSWLRDELGWTLRVVRRDNVFGPHQDVDRILTEGILDARRALAVNFGRVGDRIA